MRRTHHHALKHSLPAYQSFFATLESWQKLHGDKESNEISQGTHADLDAPGATTHHALDYHRAAGILVFDQMC